MKRVMPGNAHEHQALPSTTNKGKSDSCVRIGLSVDR